MSSSSFVPVISIQQKFPIKPSTHFMIEPYAAISFPMNTSTNNEVTTPPVEIGGGVQFGVKGGSMGAFFVDVNILFALGDVIAQNNDKVVYKHPSELHYSHFSVGLGLGYKIGFYDRPMPKPKD